MPQRRKAKRKERIRVSLPQRVMSPQRRRESFASARRRPIPEPASRPKLKYGHCGVVHRSALSYPKRRHSEKNQGKRIEMVRWRC
jgi:hypothetical protein